MVQITNSIFDEGQLVAAILENHFHNVAQYTIETLSRLIRFVMVFSSVLMIAFLEKRYFWTLLNRLLVVLPYVLYSQYELYKLKKQNYELSTRLHRLLWQTGSDKRVSYANPGAPIDGINVAANNSVSHSGSKKQLSFPRRPCSLVGLNEPQMSAAEVFSTPDCSLGTTQLGLGLKGASSVRRIRSQSIPTQFDYNVVSPSGFVNFSAVSPANIGLNVGTCMLPEYSTDSLNSDGADYKSLEWSQLTSDVAVYETKRSMTKEDSVSITSRDANFSEARSKEDLQSAESVKFGMRSDDKYESFQFDTSKIRWKNAFEKATVLRNRRLMRMKEMEIIKKEGEEMNKKLKTIRRRISIAKIRKRNCKWLSKVKGTSDVKSPLNGGGDCQFRNQTGIPPTPNTETGSFTLQTPAQKVGDATPWKLAGDKPVLRVTQKTVLIKQNRMGDPNERKNITRLSKVASKRRTTTIDSIFGNSLSCLKKNETECYLISEPQAQKFYYVKHTSTEVNKEGEILPKKGE